MQMLIPLKSYGTILWSFCGMLLGRNVLLFLVQINAITSLNAQWTAAAAVAADAAAATFNEELYACCTNDGNFSTSVALVIVLCCHCRFLCCHYLFSSSCRWKTDNGNTDGDIRQWSQWKQRKMEKRSLPKPSCEVAAKKADSRVGSKMDGCIWVDIEANKVPFLYHFPL